MLAGGEIADSFNAPEPRSTFDTSGVENRLSSGRRPRRNEVAQHAPPALDGGSHANIGVSRQLNPPLVRRNDYRDNTRPIPEPPESQQPHPLLSPTMSHQVNINPSCFLPPQPSTIGSSTLMNERLSPRRLPPPSARDQPNFKYPNSIRRRVAAPAPPVPVRARAGFERLTNAQFNSILNCLDPPRPNDLRNNELTPKYRRRVGITYSGSRNARIERLSQVNLGNVPRDAIPTWVRQRDSIDDTGLLRNATSLRNRF